jgi:hypothetical protein
LVPYKPFATRGVAPALLLFVSRPRRGSGGGPLGVGGGGLVGGVAGDRDSVDAGAITKKRDRARALAGQS